MSFIINSQGAHTQRLLWLELRHLIVCKDWVRSCGVVSADRRRDLMNQVLLCWCNGSKLCSLIMKLGDYSIYLVQTNDRVYREIIWYELLNALELLLFLFSFFINFLFLTFFVLVILCVYILNLSFSDLAGSSCSSLTIILNKWYSCCIVIFF